MSSEDRMRVVLRALWDRRDDPDGGGFDHRGDVVAREFMTAGLIWWKPADADAITEEPALTPLGREVLLAP